MIKLIYPKLSYKLTGLFYKVHNNLGRFCKEKQYADAFEILLKKLEISYKRELDLPIKFKEHLIKGNKVDFSIEDKILVDIKAKKFITKDDYNQMQRYLTAYNKKLGMIVNFRNTYLKPKRIINYSKY